MRTKLLQLALAFAATAMPALPSLAQIPDGYYNSLKGKKGAELKSAVYNIVKSAKVLSYGSGKNKTWWGFWDTDRNEQGYFIDRYSAESEWEKSTTQGEKGAGMNIEHSFPKSWWGGASNQAYKDLYNLMPCKDKINSTKSNYPMGDVESGDRGNGWTKVGKGSDNNWYWEPADPWKGDFARGYMYMATTYQNFTWSGSSALQILQQGTYPTLQKWAYTLFIKWARADKPDALEIKRNEEVYKIQGNRNPYVDFPNLMEYVWGDSIDYAFDPETTIKSTDYKNDGGGTIIPDPDQPQEESIFSANFMTSTGDCTETIDKNESTFSNIWVQTAKYGWKATAYSSKNYEADATLSLPEIDLTEYTNATLTINQAINYAKGKALDYLSVEATVIDPETGEVENSKLTDLAVPSTDSWSFSKYDLNLSQYCGSKVILKFHYTSDANICCTWEIKDLSITGTKGNSDINTSIVRTDNDGTIDLNKPYEVYTVDGRKTNITNGYKGILIIKQGNASRKIIRY